MAPSKVSPHEWAPADGFDLEPAVDRAVRSLSNSIVVAGPGAGKTELLAQRACFLLQTGICPDPRRILALSFKRDAARNLDDRVAQRCSEQHARRFDSLTFESFGKSLLDRFGMALPAHLRPTLDYEIDFEIKERSIGSELDKIPNDLLSREHAASINPVTFYRRCFTARLSPSTLPPQSANDHAHAALWDWLLHGSRPSRLNFHMIDRLAELILLTNPKILKGFRSTYSFVFLDEFQDTTDIQYDLIKTAFEGTSAVLTAVGDNKQRIMGWANALDGIFTKFVEDFSATVVRPIMNFRSAKRLVEIQQVVAYSLDRSHAPARAHDQQSEGDCRLLLFDNHEQEAGHLAGMIQRWVVEDQVRPRDICVLTRLRSPHYTETLMRELASRGIKARVESEMQDLLAEPLVATVLDMLKLICLPKAPTAWSTMIQLLSSLDGGESDKNCRLLEAKLTRFIVDSRPVVSSIGADAHQISGLIEHVMGFIGKAAFFSRHPEYAQGKWYEKLKGDFAKFMAASRKEPTWAAAIADFEGAASVPMMTMHKSKGLEYHTVVFVGLEDNALFGWRRNAHEEQCGFFVALSRAKRRVVFTFSGKRKEGDGWKIQYRNTIKDLYQLLLEAGVEPESIR